jgi:hypothetical protein
MYILSTAGDCSQGRNENKKKERRTRGNILSTAGDCSQGRNENKKKERRTRGNEKLDEE